MNILLVDHTTIYRNILAQALAEYPEFMLVFANTALEASEVADSVDVNFVIVAQHLLDAEGIDLIRKLRATGKFQYEPMVILTASPSAQLNEVAQQAGVTEVFRKHDVLELVNFLRRFLIVHSQMPGRVLYVEDEASQRNVLEAQLTEWGMQVDAFSNAEDAWNAYQNNDYDIILSDIVLSGRMSGSRFINRVRRMSGHKGDVLILALTAFDSVARRIELFHLGIDDYVGKPIVPLELRARIQGMLSRKYIADRTQLILEATSLGVMVVGETGQIKVFNPEAEKLFGYTEADVTDRPVSTLMVEPGDAAKDIFAGYLESREGNDRLTMHFEAVGIRSIGTRFPVRVSISEIAMLGGGRQFAIMARDMTDERLLADNLRRAKELAEAASRLKSDFLANMSHEIRTPMNAIIGLSHLCLQTNLTPRQQDYLGKVNVAARSLMGILNDILDLSKIEAGQMELECIPFALRDITDNLSALFDFKAHDKGLALRFDIAADVPPALMGDSLRLSQVLINLVANAIKFTEQGEVSVGIELGDEVTESVVLLFVVRDSGIGMAAPQTGRLFEAFSQADSSITRKYGGTGLGLAISKQLVGMMGGRIWVNSQPGAGTRIFFTARMQRFAGSVAELVARDRMDAGAGEGGVELGFPGAYLLLVEDNDVNQQVARELLERVGASIAIAENGNEALAMLAETAFDAVLMDLQMPLMDGITATQEIRKQERFHTLPIIAMTANAMAGDRERCLDVGMNDYIAKPIDPPLLYAALARHLPHKVLVGSVARTPAEPAPAISLPPLAGIDTAVGLQRIGQNAALYLDILFKFHDRQQSFGTELRALLAAAGEREAAERLVHTLKGLAGSIGAWELADAARELENCLHVKGNPADCTGLLDSVEASLQTVLAAIGGIAHLRPASASVDSAPLAPAALAALLREATDLLKAFNADAEKPVEKLCAVLSTSIWAERAGQVRKLVGRYDYDAALDELLSLARDMVTTEEM